MRPSRFTRRTSAVVAMAVTLGVAANAAAGAPDTHPSLKTTPPTTVAVPAPTAPPPGPTLPPAPAPVTTIAGPVSPTPTSAAAAGTTVLTDTTRRITMTVPASWTQSDLRPFVRDDGGARPTIEASPNIEQYKQDWSTPGAYVLALPPQDATALIEAWSWNNTCTGAAPQPFNDGRLVGFTQTWSACGGGTAEIVELAATSIDGSYSLYVNTRGPAPDPATQQLLFSTVGAIPGANPGEVSPPAVVPTALAAADPAIAAAAVPAGYVTVSDEETGRLSVAVDPTWVDVNGFARDNDDLSARPTLRAAPSLDAYSTEWSAPGVALSAFPFRADPYTILANLDESSRCTDGGLQPLALPTGTGYLQLWTQCGGTTTTLAHFVIVPPDQSAVIWGEIQLPTADNSALLGALASVALAPG